ncbi:MAG: hypothetical protein PUJ06_03775 [Stecheria intestinalis]|nr:hypothetical protein [Stecheria intestinalis]MDY4680519.1 hypothetical protein [Lachnospiraceae bacterium]
MEEELAIPLLFSEMPFFLLPVLPENKKAAADQRLIWRTVFSRLFNYSRKDSECKGFQNPWKEII